MTSPSTGLYSALTALTDSTSPNSSPAATYLPTGGKFHVHQVGQLLDGERRDADRGDLDAALILDVDPLVRFAVQQLFWLHNCIPYSR